MKKLLLATIAATMVAGTAIADDILDVIFNDKVASTTYYNSALLDHAFTCGKAEKLFNATDQSKIVMMLSANNISLSKKYGKKVHAEALKVYYNRVWTQLIQHLIA